MHSKRKRKFRQFFQIGLANFWRLARRKRNKYVYIDKKVGRYIDKLISRQVPSFLLDMHKKTDSLERGEMQIDLSQAEFLRFLVRTIDAKHILEIGTFRGWSTAVLVSASSSVEKVVTIELRESEAKRAEGFWNEYLSAENLAKIDLRIGNAKDILKNIAAQVAEVGEKASEKFDLIFIDADKNNYAEYLSVAKRVLNRGGLIVLDNMLNAGLVATSASDNTTEAIRKVNKQIFENFSFGDLKKIGDQEAAEFEPYMIPAWDGVVVIRKK